MASNLSIKRGIYDLLSAIERMGAAQMISSPNIAAYFWNEYLEKGWPGEEFVGGNLIFTVNRRDKHKFPELKGYRTFTVRKRADGRLKGLMWKREF